MRNVYRQSTPLPVQSLPFSISAVFSGVAKGYGFFVNGHPLFVAPTRASHRLTLEIDDQGKYEIKRDEQILSRSDLWTQSPLYFGAIDEVRLGAFGINRSMITQSVLMKSSFANHSHTNKEFSIVVCCTKYSRRLGQLIQSIARQKYDLSRVEIMVAFVPGLDTTEDIVDTARLCWKDLSILPLPFPESLATHKWKMINRGISQSHGETIIVTDADMIFPPNLLETISSEYKDALFLGANGRKMLTPQTTAKILTGTIDPIENFDALINEPEAGELKLGEAKGKPIGYFQCFKREVFEKVQYRDLPHFEGSDGFAEDVEKEFHATVIGKTSYFFIWIIKDPNGTARKNSFSSYSC
ncbi:MAG: glycosyltransferase family A protein [Bdellovibrionota bacterium]